MSMHLGVALLKQEYGDAFKYLSKELGEDLVAQVPTIRLDDKYPNKIEGDYVKPWEYPEELPFDVVKAALPHTKRPLLAIRYRDADTNKLVLEVFFQRYNFKDGECFSPSTNWVSTNLGGRPIFAGGGMASKEFQILKNILIGNDLESTGNRYLPLYQDKFMKV